MNILFLTHQGGTAGSTYSISYLARGLADRGHRIVVGCRRDVLLYELLQNTGVVLQPMTFNGRFDIGNMRQIHDAVRSYDIQLINAQSGMDRYTSVFARTLYRMDVAVVHTRRQKPMSAGFFLQTWLYHRGTDKIIAVSCGVKEGLVKLGIPENHIWVIPNGTPREKYEHIDRQATEELKKKYGLAPEEAVIGCVSRRKQQLQLLEALSHLRRRLTVIFVGITEADLPPVRSDHRLIFIGHLPQDKVLAHYPLFDIKVLPSETEGLSQALLEAMALGVPVVAANAAGNPDLIRDGENGLLYEPGNPQHLALQIERLLQDRTLYLKLQENGRRTALEEFSIDRTVLRYEEAFAQIIRNRHEKQ